MTIFNTVSQEKIFKGKSQNYSFRITYRYIYKTNGCILYYHDCVIIVGMAKNNYSYIKSYIKYIY